MMSRFHRLDVAGAAMLAAATICMGVTGSARAQSLSTAENGRYVMSPIADGVVRMDTRNGAVTTCTGKVANLICRLAPDERAALDAEIGKLMAENKRLSEQIAQRDSTVSGKVDAPLAKEDKKKSAAVAPDKTIELQLPPEHEKLMSLLDRMWDRLVDMASRLQKKLSEKT
jgi:hypothetical protein